MQNNTNLQMVKNILQIKKNNNKLITSLSLFSIILIIYIFSLLFIYFYHLNDNCIIFIVTVFKIITHIDIYCLMSNSLGSY